MPRKKKENYSSLVPEIEKKIADEKLQKLREEMDLKDEKKGKKKKWTKYKQDSKRVKLSTSGFNREFIDFITPQWCVHCIHGDNVFDVGLGYTYFRNESYFICNKEKIFENVLGKKYAQLNGPDMFKHPTMHPFWDTCEEFSGIEGPTLKTEQKDRIEKHKPGQIDMGENLTYTPGVYEKIVYCGSLEETGNKTLCGKTGMEVHPGCNKCGDFEHG